jgi:regulator of nonsense transcripts 2
VEKPKSLDSNIKKNTAFIKKCKTSMAADLKVQLLNDIKKLSLEKYISEIVGGVMEGMLKCKTSTDINACVEVSTNLLFPFFYTSSIKIFYKTRLFLHFINVSQTPLHYY